MMVMLQKKLHLVPSSNLLDLYVCINDGNNTFMTEASIVILCLIEKL